jgi:hypothetical protein
MSSLSPSCKESQTTSPERQISAPTSRKRHAKAGVKMLVSSIGLATVVAGCSLPHVASMSSNRPTPKSSQSPKSPAPTATPSATASPIAATKVAASLATPGGDLANGSLTRYLDAGSRKLVVNYWTSQDPAQWTATRSTVVNLAAHIENGDKDHAVLVSDFKATLDDGTAVTTIADDKGAFTLTPPYAYSSALVLRAHPGATSATVILKYDLLVQTAPGLMAYFRQTVIDTIHINFATPGDN